MNAKPLFAMQKQQARVNPAQGRASASVRPSIPPQTCRISFLGAGGMATLGEATSEGCGRQGGAVRWEHRDPSMSKCATCFTAEPGPAARSAPQGAAEDESVTPCVTPGSLIATPRGARPVETLQAGDKVLTRDNGQQAIRWIGSKRVGGRDLAAAPHLNPVLIQKGALGNGLPERDMRVSPNHRVLVASDRTALYFEDREVLVAAKHLVNHRGVHALQSTGISYIHFLCDRHEVVLSDGAWTESFQPGDRSLRGIGNAQRTEILELFPQLATHRGVRRFPAARKVLSQEEAERLSD